MGEVQEGSVALYQVLGWGEMTQILFEAIKGLNLPRVYIYQVV